MGRNMDEWGRQCKAQMYLKGMTLKDVAEAAGYSRTYISSVINGRMIVPDETYEKIGNVLDVSRQKRA